MFVGLAGDAARAARAVHGQGVGVRRSSLSGPLMRAMSHIPVDRAHGELAARQALPGAAGGRGRGHLPRGHDRAGLRRQGPRGLPAGRGLPRAARPERRWCRWRTGASTGSSPSTAATPGAGQGGARCVVGEPLVPLAGETAEAPDRPAARPSRRRWSTQLVDALPAAAGRAGHAWWWPASRGGAAPSSQTARRPRRGSASPRPTHGPAWPLRPRG